MASVDFNAFVNALAAEGLKYTPINEVMQFIINNINKNLPKARCNGGLYDNRKYISAVPQKVKLTRICFDAS